MRGDDLWIPILTLRTLKTFMHDCASLKRATRSTTLTLELWRVQHLPLQLLHHTGLSKEEIAYKQHKVVEESDFMLDFVEPMITRINEMIGFYQPRAEL